MAREIERTFLVKNYKFVEMATDTIVILQGYLNRDPERTVRVRLANEKAYITIKGKNHGCARNEFEYEIPLDDARQILSMCTGRIIDKTRYIVPFEGHIWEVDVYNGDLKGLIVTEVELEREDEPVILAPFAGKEVTGDPKYYNSQL